MWAWECVFVWMWTLAPDGKINNKMNRGILWVSVIMNINYNRDSAPRHLTIGQIFLCDKCLLYWKTLHTVFSVLILEEGLQRGRTRCSSGESLLFSHNMNQCRARGALASLNGFVETWRERSHNLSWCFIPYWMQQKCKQSNQIGQIHWLLCFQPFDLDSTSKSLALLKKLVWVLGC